MGALPPHFPGPAAEEACASFLIPINFLMKKTSFKIKKVINASREKLKQYSDT